PYRYAVAVIMRDPAGEQILPAWLGREALLNRPGARRADHAQALAPLTGGLLPALVHVHRPANDPPPGQLSRVQRQVRLAVGDRRLLEAPVDQEVHRWR